MTTDNSTLAGGQPSGRPALDHIVVVDTNVLLADPNAILSFPRAEVLIPEMVLAELDKLKTARVDPDLRFRGREVSRLLFDLSEEGSLVEGVELPDGGYLRVIPFDNDVDLPDGLSTRNADDRILATAYAVVRSAAPGTRVELVTNDLNMLLKAQTVGVAVRRYGEGVEGGFTRRFIIRPFQRYKVPLGILAIAIAVFGAVIVLSIQNRQSSLISTGSLPTEFREILSTQQQGAFDALGRLESNPEDAASLLTMGNFYYGRSEAAGSSGDQAARLQYSKQGISYYEHYLAKNPEDNEARADMASLYFYSGDTDRAIREVGTVLSKNRNHVFANFNLGIFYWQGRHDLKAAADQMSKVVTLTANDQSQANVNARAQMFLTEIKKELSGSASTTNTGVTTP